MGRTKGALNKPKPEPKKEWGRLSLLLLNGKEVDVDYQENVFDEMWDDMMTQLGKDGVWFCGNWDKNTVEVTYCGVMLDFLNMNKVIGII